MCAALTLISPASLIDGPDKWSRVFLSLLLILSPSHSIYLYGLAAGIVQQLEPPMKCGTLR